MRRTCLLLRHIITYFLAKTATATLAAISVAWESHNLKVGYMKIFSIVKYFSKVTNSFRWTVLRIITSWSTEIIHMKNRHFYGNEWHITGRSFSNRILDTLTIFAKTCWRFLITLPGFSSRKLKATSWPAWLIAIISIIVFVVQS